MEAKENEKKETFITLRLITELNPKPNDIDSKWRKEKIYSLGKGTLRLDPKAKTLEDHSLCPLQCRRPLQMW